MPFVHASSLSVSHRFVVYWSNLGYLVVHPSFGTIACEISYYHLCYAKPMCMLSLYQTKYGIVRYLPNYCLVHFSSYGPISQCHESSLQSFNFKFIVEEEWCKRSGPLQQQLILILKDK